MGNLFSRAYNREESADLEEIIIVRDVYDFEESLVNDLSASKFDDPNNKMSGKTSSNSKDVYPDFTSTRAVVGFTSSTKPEIWSSISGNQQCPEGVDQSTELVLCDDANLIFV